MKVLIIGSGGREHALAWKIMQSPHVKQIFVSPGNGGTATEAGITNIDIQATNISALTKFALENHINLTVVGPEAPLVAGIVDVFRAEGLAIVGPTMVAAKLEGSKAFAKNFLQKYNIPTANAQIFTDVEEARQYILKVATPLVIKADGLASGKGVTIAKTQQEAIEAMLDVLQKKRFGDAGNQVIIEDYLQGEEASFIVMSDGSTVLPLASSQDHKTLLAGNQGPNTGGMGAISPAPCINATIHEKILQQIIYPTINGMKMEGTPYTGFLYAGLMITPTNDIKVLEYNCRLGDPEAQTLLMRLQTDLYSLCLASTEGRLPEHSAKWDIRPAVGVVMANKGYPANYETGQVINGFKTHNNSKIFHGGTTLNPQGKIITNGGRVLCVTSLGETLQDARSSAYQIASSISWSHAYYRKDIGA